MLLGILAFAALILLVYEVSTLGAAVIWPLLNNPAALQTDFHYYYEAALRFARDRNQLYNPADDWIAGFAYPPLAILPFLALSRLPLGVALLCLIVASYAAVGVALRMWWLHLRDHGVAPDSRSAMAAALIALTLGPTYSNAVYGQVNAFVLLSCVAFVRWGARRPKASGVLLAIGAWLKIYPVIMIGMAAWNRRMWRAVGCLAIAAVALPIVALPIVPPSAHRDFIGGVVPARIDKTAIHITNQSLVAFLERFRVPPSGFLYWTGEQAVTVGTAVRAFNSGATALALVMLWYHARFRKRELASEAILMALIAVVAPLGWGHTYIMVLPLVMLRLVEMRSMDRARALTTAACVLALMIPAGRVFSFADAWPQVAQNLVYSRYLLATVALALLAPPAYERRGPDFGQ